MHKRLILATVLGAGLMALTACATPTNAKLTDEQICRNHYENDPVERDRCSLDPGRRDGSPPQARPQDLPIRTDQPGGRH
jgi:hypothetical protein